MHQAYARVVSLCDQQELHWMSCNGLLFGSLSKRKYFAVFQGFQQFLFSSLHKFQSCCTDIVAWHTSKANILLKKMS